MKTSDYDYELPLDLIAQVPAPQRDQSRLLVLHRNRGILEHQSFGDLLDYLRPDDVLVMNNSRVIPARMHARKDSGGLIEILLVEEISVNNWWVMLRPAKRVPIGSRLNFFNALGKVDPLTATVMEKNLANHFHLSFKGVENVMHELHQFGEVPLPPYIQRRESALLSEDLERYQTVYARHSGSVAAPTAGLHFTNTLMEKIHEAGAKTCFVTLHVGPATFAPVKVANLEDHPMHEERFELGSDAAAIINHARQEGHRIIAVGTTSVRVLESVAAENNGQIISAVGRTRLFIHPPHLFRVVNAMLTNFHLPKSTLLMLVSAFATPGTIGGRELVLSAYAEAIRERYRFFSYGDAMLLL